MTPSRTTAPMTATTRPPISASNARPWARCRFELAAQHFRLMETMRTQDYLTFRDKLNPASGFQSAQMREIGMPMTVMSSRPKSRSFELS